MIPRMEEVGFVTGCLFIIVAPAVLFVVYRVRSDAAEAAKRRAVAHSAAVALENERRSRGAKITELLRRFPRSADPDQSVGELRKYLQSPIGFLPELTQAKGWFEQVAPILRALFLKANSRTADVVVMYFQAFTFPASQQTPVLVWLDGALDIITVPDQEHLFRRIVNSVLSESDPAGSDWLYRRTLERVRNTNGAPGFKALALHVGRLRYGAGRPDRQPTLYDEQAIANDIAACIQ
jgi:hypothetical protein